MSPERPRRIAPWLALCLVVPLAAGTAPGSFRSEATESCTEIPCLLWMGTHEGPEDQATAHHLALSPDGRTAYAVGGTSTVETFTDLVTWAVDVRTGELLWSAVYDGGRGEEEVWYYDVRAIGISPDGSRVTVAGTSHGGFGMGHDIVTLAYDAATGAQLWEESRFHGGPESDEDIATAIAVDRTSTYVVTAGSVVHRDGTWGGILLGHDLATGERLWELPFSSPCGDSDILGVKATPASSAIFVGGLLSGCLSDSVEETPQEVDLTFIPTIWAVDPATGAVLWEAQDDDPLLTMQSAMLIGALEATDESVVLSSRITNPRNPNTDLDVLTMAVDPEGQFLWRARYDSMGRDDLLGLKAAPDGSRVYMVARSPALAAAGEQDQNQDIIVTAYDRGGAVAWSTRLDSSTTGVTFDGATLGGEGKDTAVLSVPALFDSGARLAIGYTAWIESPVPFVGPVGPNAHVLAVLDTDDGSVAAVRTDEASLEEYTYAAMYDRADLVGVGSDRVGFDSAATIRRLSLDVTPPDLSLPGSMVREAAGPGGAVIDYTATATDDRDGDVAVTCSPASGTAFPLGATGVSCLASDSYGNVASGSFEVRVEDSTPPALHLPDGVAATATGRDGTAVVFASSAQDLVDGDVPVSCSHTPGQTFPPGTTRVSCDAADAEGNLASSAFDVVVTYAWTGFQDPVRSDGSSEFQHGRTVPVKVELTDDSAGITDAIFRLWVQTEGGVEVPAIGHGSSSNRLAYDDETGTYRFLWNTSTVLPGDHRLRLDLGDGTQNVVAVRLT